MRVLVARRAVGQDVSADGFGWRLTKPNPPKRARRPLGHDRRERRCGRIQDRRRPCSLCEVTLLAVGLHMLALQHEARLIVIEVGRVFPAILRVALRARLLEGRRVGIVMTLRALPPQTQEVLVFFLELDDFAIAYQRGQVASLALQLRVSACEGKICRRFVGEVFGPSLVDLSGFERSRR